MHTPRSRTHRSGQGSGFSILLSVLLVIMLAATLGCQRRPPAAPMAPPPAPSTSYQFEEQYVTAYRLNVRSGPSTNNRIIAVLKRGEAVQIMERVNDWFKVRRPPNVQPQDGFVEGWVYGGYITNYENEIQRQHNRGEGKPWG